MTMPGNLPATDRGAGYYVRVYSDSGLPLYVGRPAELQYTETLNAPGAFKVVFTGDDVGDAGVYAPDRTRLILIERVDGNRVIDDFVGRIERRETRRVRVDYGENNPDEIYSVEIHGPSIDIILAERVIPYPAGGAYADKTGPADDVMRQYVRENLGQLCLDVDRRVSTAYLDVEADTSSAPTISAAASGDTLADVLEACAAVSEDQGVPLYYGLVREPTSDNALKLVFRVRPYAWAADRGRDSGFPLVLSYANGRLENPALVEDHEDVDNVVYLIPPGSQDAAEPVAYLGAGWDAGVFTRSERVVSAGASVTATQEDAIVAAELARNAPRIKLTADIVTEGPGAAGIKYGWDWVSGTRVVAEFEDYSANAIVGTVSIEATAERPTRISASISSERAV